MDTRLCINCKHYGKREAEHLDMCLHPAAFRGGVRELKTYTCEAMRAGICGKDAKHYEGVVDE